MRPAVGDVDGDGIVDVLLARTDASGLLLLRGRPNRIFTVGETFFQGPAPGRIALLDWDADGVLDLLMQTATSDRCTASSACPALCPSATSAGEDDPIHPP